MRRRGLRAAAASSADVTAALVRSLARLKQFENLPRLSKSGEIDPLAPTRDLLLRVRNPERCFRAVHVTGTKGKGSVCALVESALHGAGWRVGRYGSPHVQRINERVSLSCREVDDGSLAHALNQSLEAREAAYCAGTSGARAGWFELLTVAAFIVFRDAGVEWAIVEVGIGGRCDPTNVIDGEVAVVTNVELEHTDLLGVTRTQIAAEKAGIIKQGALVVTTLASSDEAGRVVAAHADNVAATMNQLNIEAGASMHATNLEIARAVLAALGKRGVTNLNDQRLLHADDLDGQAVDRATLPGRMERFRVLSPNGSRNVTVVLDGAHVAFAAKQALADTLDLTEHLGAPVVVVGMGADKNAWLLLGAMQGRVAHAICVPVPGSRDSVAAEVLAALGRRLGIKAEASAHPSMALRRALALADRRWILVIGSLRLAGAMRELLLNSHAATTLAPASHSLTAHV